MNGRAFAGSGSSSTETAQQKVQPNASFSLLAKDKAPGSTGYSFTDFLVYIVNIYIHHPRISYERRHKKTPRSF